MSLEKETDAAADQADTGPESPLRVRAFAWFFTGRIVSLLGSAMAPVALAFAVLNASGSAGDMGVVLTAQTVPVILFTLAGGVIGDRFSRQWVLLLSHTGAGLTQAAVAAMLLTGNYHLGALVVLEFLNGTMTAFTTPALRGIVPDIVAKNQKQKANSLLGSARNAAKILGPTAGGTLVATAGGGWAIAADAATYLVAAFCLAQLHLDTKTPPPKKSPLADIREGWTEFTSRTWVWAIVASFGVTNYLQVGIWTVLGPLIAKGSIGEAAWGLVLSVKSVGVLLMALVMYRVTVRRLLPLGQLCIALTALPLLALGLRADVYWLAVATFVAGLGTGVYGIAWETSLQDHVPRHMLSRISSYDNLGSFIAIPAGQLTAARFADAFGASRVALVGGILYAFFALLPLTASSVRTLRHEP
ncbi:MFS transporter [Streptomyces sclerotialus]|uniref:MFS transporter n=1 Tax=Streptomyces sclerotialus TaxID=1957 RepID=UPI000AD50DC2